MRTAAYFGGADRVSAPARRRAAGRGLPQRIPPLPQRAVGETTLNKKMRAFGDEVALTVAPFYLIHMLQRTLPPGFIAPCLPTKLISCPQITACPPSLSERATHGPTEFQRRGLCARPPTPCSAFSR